MALPPSIAGLLLWPVLAAQVVSAQVASAPHDQKQVLVLYSTRRDAQLVTLGERELPLILERGVGSLDYYSEYIDQARFPDPDYQLAFRDFLRVKYRGVRFDIVIAIQDTVLDFLGDELHDLFPESPVVFIASSSAAKRRLPNSTGLIADLNLGDTLALAIQLQPEIERVFVVTGADMRDKVYEKIARQQFRRFEPQVAITYLAGLTTRDLEDRLAALPRHSIVYYVLVNRDGAGEVFHPLEYADRLAAVANAPIYSWVDSLMDHGIVGGSLRDQRTQIREVGTLAVRVLSGESADSIPTSEPNLEVKQVDWRQLRRWGISESRVPAGTLMRFREPSAWDQYRGYILGAIAIVLAQTGLIAGLLVQRTRRRHAEARVRGGEAALRASYDRIRDLGSRLLTAQDSERSRIARELHDDISQQIALMTMDLEQLINALPPDAEGLAGEALDRAHGIAKSVHALSHRLHPAKLRLIGLVTALEALQRELSRPELVITFTHEDVPPAVPPDLTLCLFRVVQEALQNTLKYSHARRASVHLHGGSKGLALTIEDDGAGFDVDAAWGKGLGLISMSERLEAIGGTLKIHSRPGAGTRLDVWVPLWTKRSGRAVHGGVETHAR